MKTSKRHSTLALFLTLAMTAAAGLQGADSADRAIAVLDGHDIPAWVAGEVSSGGEGRVTLTGDHR